jgi:UDP-N-acetylmuramoylalanine--D-glutamate ligase
MVLRGKRVLVVGLARTGVETARFLAGRGAVVFATDRKREAELAPALAELRGLPVKLFLGEEDPRRLAGVELVIPSPGVPPENPLLREAERRGVEILSEIELAFRFLSAPLVAITGTNGKSTTAELTAHILRSAGRRVFLGGNIGVPLIRFVGGDWEWGVVEVSSFQLERVRDFRPKIALVLNVTDDHLDRYPDFSSYCRAKENIFRAQGPGDLAILNRDDPGVWQMRGRIRAELFSFGWEEVAEGVYATSDAVVWRRGGEEERFPLGRVRLLGVHNVENIMAAVAAGKAAGAPRGAVQEAIETFRGLEHRLEYVCEKGGVRFYNDSKATNVGAVLKSLMSFSAPVILIAGGVDKGGSYAPLAEEVRRKVKRLVLFGAAKEKIAGALGQLAPTVLVEDLPSAVATAYRDAVPGDVVLLSPACSSFDMFRDYAERGRAFKDLVLALERR